MIYRIQDSRKMTEKTISGLGLPSEAGIIILVPACFIKDFVKFETFSWTWTGKFQAIYLL